MLILWLGLTTTAALLAGKAAADVDDFKGLGRCAERLLVAFLRRRAGLAVYA